VIAAVLHGVFDLTMGGPTTMCSTARRGPREQWLLKHASLGRDLNDPALAAADPGDAGTAPQ